MRFSNTLCYSVEMREEEATYSKLSLSRLKEDLQGYSPTVVQDSAPNRHLVLTGGGSLGEEVVLLYFDGYMEISSDLGRHTVSGSGDMLEWIVKDGELLVGMLFNRKWEESDEGYWRRSMNLTPESIDEFGEAEFAEGVWERFDEWIETGPEKARAEEVYEDIESFLWQRKEPMTGVEAYGWAGGYERNGFSLRGMWEEDTKDLLLSYVWSYRVGYLVSRMCKEGEL